MRSHRLFHVVRIKNVLMDTVHKNGKNIMFTKLNQLLLISTILLLVSSPSKAKIDEEKKGKAEGGGNEVFRIGGSPRQHWAWFSPVLLDQYWHTSPFATPTYSLNADESKFELTYKIEGYGKDEIDVELSPNGNLLHIKGEKAQEDKEYKSVTKFHHSFALDPTVSAEKIKAKIDGGGNLVVTVPRKADRPQHVYTKIPIFTLQDKTVE
jgi:HSP20 family molecular chaperone IbpA